MRSVRCARPVSDRARQLPAAGILGEQRGAILPLMALLLVTLIGIAGFAVDLGWIFWNSLEVQHGADAAALGGVVHVAEDTDEAKDTGRAAAAANGYVDTTLGGADVVQVIDFNDDVTAVENKYQLRTVITRQVPTFFMAIFGIDTVDISRSAVAEYVLPLPLGSPEAYLATTRRATCGPTFGGTSMATTPGRGWGTATRLSVLSGRACRGAPRTTSADCRSTRVLRAPQVGTCMGSRSMRRRSARW